MPKNMEEDFGSDFDVGTEKKARSGGIKWETVLPIIIIVIVLLLIVFKTNILAGGMSIFGTTQGARILVLGAPTKEFRDILSDQENKDIIKEVSYRTLEAIEHNPIERIKGFDIIILDQSGQTDKSISRRSADAITDFVKKGGKLIVVLNSGIKRPEDPSVLGWTANFDNIVPVTCDAVMSVPSCISPREMVGTLYASIEDHPIMQGIEKVPAVDTSGPIKTITFEVSANGKEIAFLDEPRTGKTYTGIVEKQLMIGKVIYFNFNPAISKAIVINTIKYLS